VTIEFNTKLEEKEEQREGGGHSDIEVPGNCFPHPKLA